MDSSYTVVCGLAVAHLGRSPRKEQVEPVSPRSLIQIQSLMARYRLNTLLIESRGVSSLVSGVRSLGDHNYQHSRLGIESIFGHRPTPERLVDLAHSLKAHTIDMHALRTGLYNIANKPSQSLATINQIAASVAPMLLLQGDQASLDVIDISQNSFDSERQAQQFAQHVDAWMRSLLTGQGLDHQLADDISERIRKALDVDDYKPGPSHSMR